MEKKKNLGRTQAQSGASSPLTTFRDKVQLEVQGLAEFVLCMSGRID